jgi:hypothetical protein
MIASAWRVDRISQQLSSAASAASASSIGTPASRIPS